MDILDKIPSNGVTLANGFKTYELDVNGLERMGSRVVYGVKIERKVLEGGLLFTSMINASEDSRINYSLALIHDLGDSSASLLKNGLIYALNGIDVYLADIDQ